MFLLCLKTYSKKNTKKWDILQKDCQEIDTKKKYFHEL